MKRFLKIILILVGISIAAYISINYYLKEYAKDLVERIQPKLLEQGIIIEEITYKNVKLNSLRSINIHDFKLKFHLNREFYGKKSFDADFNADNIKVILADIDSPSVFFTISNFNLNIIPNEDSPKKTNGKFENGYLRCRIPIYLNDPEESVREILDQMNALFHENKISMDIDFRSDVHLGIDDKEVKVGLFTVREDSIIRMKFISSDVIAAAKEFDLDLSEKEANVISNYPNRVAALIKISRDAKRISEKAGEGKTGFPKDAVKHIYWSYHLSKEFGTDFAKEIADAHETEIKNTHAEHLMDYHNNEIARRYAEENLSIDELTQRVLHSDDIIRFPKDVSGKKILGLPDSLEAETNTPK